MDSVSTPDYQAAPDAGRIDAGADGRIDAAQLDDAVKTRLNQSIDGLVEAVGRGENGADFQQRVRVVPELRQLRVALKRAELGAASMFAHAIELLHLKAAAESAARRRRLFDAVRQALSVLQHYLRALQSRQPLSPLALLDQMNVVRRRVGLPAMREYDVFTPALPLPIAPARGPRMAPAARIQRIDTLHRRFRLQLLGWLAGDSDDSRLETLFALCDQLQQLGDAGTQRQLWWVAGGFMEVAVASGRLDDNAVKAQFARLEAEIRRMKKPERVPGTDAAVHRSMRCMLYYIGINPQVASTRVAQIRHQCGLPFWFARPPARQRVNPALLARLQAVATALDDLRSAPVQPDVIASIGKKLRAAAGAFALLECAEAAALAQSLPPVLERLRQQAAPTEADWAPVAGMVAELIAAARQRAGADDNTGDDADRHAEAAGMRAGMDTSAADSAAPVEAVQPDATASGEQSGAAARALFLLEAEATLGAIHAQLQHWRKTGLDEQLQAQLGRCFHTLIDSATAVADDTIVQLGRGMEMLLGEHSGAVDEAIDRLNLLEEMHDGLAAHLGLVAGGGPDVSALQKMLAVLLAGVDAPGPLPASSAGPVAAGGAGHKTAADAPPDDAAERAAGAVKPGDLPALADVCNLVRAVAGRHRSLAVGSAAAVLKSDGSLVTQTDIALQEQLQRELQQRWPQYGFVGEEMRYEQQLAAITQSRDGYWVLDPLDGTTNFSSGFLFYGISLALVIDGTAHLGVVFDPVRSECFSAERGRGALLNGRPLVSSKPTILAECIANVDYKRLVASLAERLVRAPPYRSQRNLGASVLEWCWLASGRIQLYLHGGQKLWDFAAGYLILLEAGGAATSLSGLPLDYAELRKRAIVAASNADLLRQWLAWIKENSVHSYDFNAA